MAYDQVIKQNTAYVSSFITKMKHQGYHEHEIHVFAYPDITEYKLLNLKRSCNMLKLNKYLLINFFIYYLSTSNMYCCTVSRLW